MREHLRVMVAGGLAALAIVGAVLWVTEVTGSSPGNRSTNGQDPSDGDGHAHPGAAPPTTTTIPAPTRSTSTSSSSRSSSTEPPSTTAPPTNLSEGAAGWWVPQAGLEWQWEIDHPPSLSSASDMGTGVSTYLGTPAANPTVYDIDGFDNSATTVTALRNAGDHVICYIEVGAAENYRADYSEFPTRDLGRSMPGYPAERYININDPAVVSIIESRISMCAAKGFNAVEPDIDDSYTDDTGFAISEAENIAYDRRLAAYAHGLGLAWGLKNGDHSTFASALEPTSDFVIDEQCHQYNTCGAFSSYVAAGKAVLEVEYNLAASAFCPAANAANEDAMLMNVNLNGGRAPCR
jgi:hypothetical protein